MIKILFEDRADAGKKLADIMEEYKSTDTLILAIPRGGLIVGVEIARRFNLEIDLIIPRKIGAPFNPEMAVGAVTQDKTVILNCLLLDRLGLREEDLKDQITQEVKEIDRRMRLYRKSNHYPEYKQKNIILVDDGIATGYTVFASINSIKKIFNPDNVILAVPVAPFEIIEKLKSMVNIIKCLHIPEDFYAVGQFYKNFGQTSDQEVIDLMEEIAKIN